MTNSLVCFFFPVYLDALHVERAKKMILHALFGLTKTKNVTIFWYFSGSLTHTIKDKEFTDRDLNFSQSCQIQ